MSCMYGMRKYQIERIIRGHLDKNPDLKSIKIDEDHELIELVD